MKTISHIAVPAMALLLAGCARCSGPVAMSDAALSLDAGPTTTARILDVFFGLDHALPAKVMFICPEALGLDGIPVTFSVRVGPLNPAPTAFRIMTKSGALHTPLCTTVRPAVDPAERHTVLMMGELGRDPSDPPVRLDIVGSVPLADGSDAIGLSSLHVTPLAAGPSLLLALRYLPGDLAGTACPAVMTKQIIQVTWSGGVTKPGGGDPGDAERQRMHVSVAAADGGVRDVVPFALADLGDSDNYVQLCLDNDALPLLVSVEAGTLVDPRGDLNDATSVTVQPGTR
jgi:hypothetical protein